MVSQFMTLLEIKVPKQVPELGDVILIETSESNVEITKLNPVKPLLRDNPLPSHNGTPRSIPESYTSYSHVV